MVSGAQIGAVAAVTALLGAGGAAIGASQVDVPDRASVAVATVGAPEAVVDDPDDLLAPEDEARLRADAERLDVPSTVHTLHWLVFDHSRDNVNDSIEEFMRENYPEQIGNDKLASGVVIIGAAVDSREVFAFAAEDVADQLFLREGQRLEGVNDAIKPGMGDNNISAALFAGARKAFDAGDIETYALVSAEDERLGAGVGAGVAAGGVGLAASSLAVGVVNRRRRAIDQGRQDYELVTREYAELGKRLDEVDLRANSLTSAFVDAELRNQWAQVRDRFLEIHEEVSGPGGIGRIDVADDKEVYANRERLTDAAETVRRTSHAEDNINRLFAIENGDAAARRSDLTDIRKDVKKARLAVKDPKLEAELADLEARIEKLDQSPTDPGFLDAFVRVLGDYRVVLEEVKHSQFSDVKEYNALQRPAIYDRDFYYSNYVPFVILNSWHSSNVAAQQSAQSSSSSGTNTTFSSGFSASGGSSSY